MYNYSQRVYHQRSTAFVARPIKRQPWSFAVLNIIFIYLYLIVFYIAWRICMYVCVVHTCGKQSCVTRVRTSICVNVLLQVRLSALTSSSSQRKSVSRRPQRPRVADHPVSAVRPPCRVRYAVLTDRTSSGQASVEVCGGGNGSRQRHVYLSTGNVVEISIDVHRDSPDYFVLLYEGRHCLARTFNFISAFNDSRKSNRQTNKKRKLNTNAVRSNHSVHLWLSQRLRYR